MSEVLDYGLARELFMIDDFIMLQKLLNLVLDLAAVEV